MTDFDQSDFAAASESFRAVESAAAAEVAAAVESETAVAGVSTVATAAAAADTVAAAAEGAVDFGRAPTKQLALTQKGASMRRRASKQRSTKIRSRMPLMPSLAALEDSKTRHPCLHSEVR